MKRDQFFQIRSMTESLGASTYCRYQVGSLAVELDGRCSPYSSHGSIRYEEAPPIPHGLLTVRNGKHTLGIVLSPYPEWREEYTNVLGDASASPYAQEAIGGVFPSAMFSGLIRDALEFGILGEQRFPGSQLLEVRALRPAAAGWFFDGGWHVPIPALTPERRDELHRSCLEVVATHGHLTVWQLDGCPPWLPFGHPNMQVLNHTIAWADEPTLASRPFVGIDGLWCWGMASGGNDLEISSPDHEPVKWTPAAGSGYYLLTHPAPSGRID